MSEKETGHPDAAQDQQMVIQTIHSEVEPVIRHLIERIQQQDDQLQQMSKAIDGIIGGFSEALTGHRKSGLSASLNFGDDFDYDGINSVYSDWEGSDLKEDLIDYITENDIPDDQLEELIANLKENAKAKYGKYKKVDEPSVDEPSVDEPSVDSEVSPEMAEEKLEPKEEKKPGKPGDELYSKLMEQYRASRGNKL